ncbi:MAG: 50S ribosomal protein L19 [Candidatus Saccharibacteria bacterium]|nr:50S ribosomal protein L19 [Candidatus Saccharibacteria bacterium]
MSFSILKQIGDAQKKKAVVDVRSGDTVKVTQKIKEGDKFRFQVFEGVVVRVERKDSHTERIFVRKVTSGVGVEKSYLVHSPLIEKIEITKRAKVRRNNLNYLRERSGKSARLVAKDFDRAAVNSLEVVEANDEVASSEVMDENSSEEAKDMGDVKEATEAGEEAKVEEEVEAAE